MACVRARLFFLVHGRSIGSRPLWRGSVVSLRRIRELLGPDSPETDLEIELLRDQLMLVANAAFDAARDRGLHMGDDEDLLQIAERAAIMEVDGGIQRREAEDAAFQLWAKKRFANDKSVN
jgi:hypothetical protein